MGDESLPLHEMCWLTADSESLQLERLEQPPIIVQSSSPQLRTAHGWDSSAARKELEALARNQENHIRSSRTAMDLGELPHIGLTRYWLSPRYWMREVTTKLPRIRRRALPAKQGLERM